MCVGISSANRCLFSGRPAPNWCNAHKSALPFFSRTGATHTCVLWDSFPSLIRPITAPAYRMQYGRISRLWMLWLPPRFWTGFLVWLWRSVQRAEVCSKSSMFVDVPFSAAESFHSRTNAISKTISSALQRYIIWYTLFQKYYGSRAQQTGNVRTGISWGLFRIL
jgi:hypothetical protein